MVDPAAILQFPEGSVVAPAGFGKTELLSKVAGLGSRSLVLTHTHAGVNAVRARMKRLGIPASRASVDTLAGWAMKYCHAFPASGNPPAGMPTGEQWDLLYGGVISALNSLAVREVFRASYDFVLIDEYQDCNRAQHNLANRLAELLPVFVFGDPMQGIFEFAGATLSWVDDVLASFPHRGSLIEPQRWLRANSALGQWISETRVKLQQGERIDLEDPRIDFRVSETAFDMGALFEGLQEKQGSVAAIHCSKQLCYSIARAANGGYQAIEELSASRLSQFVAEWDASTEATDRFRAAKKLIGECFHAQAPESERTASDGPDMVADAERALVENAREECLVTLINASRASGQWKLYRAELIRDVERACNNVVSGRSQTMSEAAVAVRRRTSMTGRRLPQRTVSTPLLLKGLEFDHVVIPDAEHFARQNRAQAKLFYVAISRATQSLRITSPSRWIQFPVPSL